MLRPVMLRLIFLELYVEVIIHRVNELPTFHAGFFRSLAKNKHLLCEATLTLTVPGYSVP
jgi:hypothetical protein